MHVCHRWLKFELLMREWRQCPRTIKFMYNSKCYLCLPPHPLNQCLRTSKGNIWLCSFPATRFLCRQFNFSVCKYSEIRLLCVCFVLCRLIKYASPGCYLERCWSIHVPGFMRILWREGLSICQRLLARLLVWLIVALMGKENQVGLTLTFLCQFFICLLVTNSCSWE